MCSVCLHNPCHPSCPNAEPEKPECYCDVCKSPIYAGNEYYDANGTRVCKDCLEEMDLTDLMEVFGVEYTTA